jgi:hypothetical protein
MRLCCLLFINETAHEKKTHTHKAQSPHANEKTHHSGHEQSRGLLASRILVMGVVGWSCGHPTPCGVWYVVCMRGAWGISDVTIRSCFGQFIADAGTVAALDLVGVIGGFAILSIPEGGKRRKLLQDNLLADLAELTISVLRRVT